MTNAGQRNQVWEIARRKVHVSVSPFVERGREVPRHNDEQQQQPAVSPLHAATHSPPGSGTRERRWAAARSTRAAAISRVIAQWSSLRIVPTP